MATRSSFTLIGIQILPECDEKIRKVLVPSGSDKTQDDGWFLFTDQYKVESGKLVRNEEYRLPLNFFSTNGKVSVSAIVGKNGSGKSTVVEILLAIINNLSIQLGASRIYSKLSYINGLYAELHYAVEQVEAQEKDWDLFRISVKDKEVSMFKNEQEIKVRSYPQRDDNIGLSSGWLNAKDARDNLEKLFYSIVANYSLHAYNIEGAHDRDWWLQLLTHKNDGYGIPITINPYRWQGKLDMIRDTRLTNRRLGALLCFFEQYHQPKIDFLDGYTLDRLHFDWRKEHVTEKYKETELSKPITFSIRYKHKRYFDLILDEYLKENGLRKWLKFDAFTDAYRYIVHKIVNISRTYPSYRGVKIPSDKNTVRFLEEAVSPWDLREVQPKVEALIRRIQRDKTHITLKLRQTVNYLRYVEENGVEAVVTKNGLGQDYIRWVLNFRKIGSEPTLSDIEEAYPPPFFVTQISLTPTKGEDKTPRPFTKLSSGERQFLFYISTVLYHLQNLNSISQYTASRVFYRRVLVVLEEVELYFHPEYQRHLVDKLIRHIEACGFKNLEHIHLLLVSHSPFVLSDIPSSNVLFVDQGKQVKDRSDLCAFGANIHEMLCHSFFLEGFMGKFATGKIQEWIKLLDGPKKNITDHRALRYQLEQIGEPLIREQLLARLDEIQCSENEAIKTRLDQIKILQREIDQLCDETNRDN